MRTPDETICSKCQVPVRHVAGGLALCAVCGVSSQTRSGGRAPKRDDRDLERLLAERRELEREIERRRAQIARAAQFPTRVALISSSVGLVLAAVILTGLVLAFLWYGSINYRYVTVYAALLVTFGATTIGALVWAACDPNAPVRRMPHARLDAAERALRDLDDLIDRRI